jgi:hypothetical protein
MNKLNLPFSVILSRKPNRDVEVSQRLSSIQNEES